MLKKIKVKLGDMVKFDFKEDELTGVVTAIHMNNKLVRVRVLKAGRRAWHEWLKPNKIIRIVN